MCQTSHCRGAENQADNVARITPFGCTFHESGSHERPASPDRLHFSSRQLSHQLRNKATALANLADAISAQGDKMEHRARRAMVRKIQLLALELGQLAERSGSSGTPNAEADSPWFDGLIFLTPREYDVLRALSFGASTRRIGELFGISTSTVRSHVKSILAKLGGSLSRRSGLPPSDLGHATATAG